MQGEIQRFDFEIWMYLLFSLKARNDTVAVILNTLTS